MSRPHGILFDLDGVIYNGETPIEGSAEVIAWVRRERIPYLLVTNTTSQPRQTLVNKLQSMGIAASTNEIWTPAVAANLWLSERGVSPAALFVPPETAAEFQDVVISDEGAKAVVVGDLGSSWDFATLNRAFRLLHADTETQLVALGMTRYWMSPTGPSLDVAPFVVALVHATGRRAVVLGKPSREFFDAAALKLGLPAADLLMIGDDIRADVGGAQGAGLRGAIVKTGKFRPEDLEQGVQPDAVLNSVADFPDWWLTVARSDESNTYENNP
ncbi:MAG: TIGR01458 family HAD-type hydrolase [Acidobacteria bacterium]|nr:TIGR01458 family HAD-type hydrolase [Acidobacteriota bacterium]MDA1234618.1 TIGR01458 family HAD-type hydrolase [Acidobacteriota bacterium]